MGQGGEDLAVGLGAEAGGRLGLLLYTGEQTVEAGISTHPQLLLPVLPRKEGA